MTTINESKKTSIIATVVATFVALMMLAVLFSPVSMASVPDDAEIEDHGEFWALKLNMMFTGADAQEIEWDFGDGSPVSTEWNPSHTYAEIGAYVIRQTVSNDFEGGSSATAYYRVHMMGDPFVNIIQPSGAPAMDNIYAKVHFAAEQPADPIWTGHTFGGWFADEELTAEFNWTQKLDAPVDAYAAWSVAGAPVVEHTLTIEDSDGIVKTITVNDGEVATMPEAPEGKEVTYYTDEEMTTEFDWTTVITADITIYQSVTDIEEDVIIPAEPKVINGTELALIGVALLLTIVAVYTRRPMVAVVVLILVAIVSLGVLDIVNIPEIFSMFEGFTIPTISSIFEGFRL